MQIHEDYFVFKVVRRNGECSQIRISAHSFLDDTLEAVARFLRVAGYITDATAVLVLETPEPHKQEINFDEDGDEITFRREEMGQ